jgi:hypothetical protein
MDKSRRSETAKAVAEEGTVSTRAEKLKNEKVKQGSKSRSFVDILSDIFKEEKDKEL